MVNSTRLLLYAIVLSVFVGACKDENTLHRPAALSVATTSAALVVSAALDFMSGNPILPVPTADPDIIYANGRYYIYTTATGSNNSQFHAYSSADLLSWTDEGVVLDLNNVTWAHTGGWAPCVVARNGNFYMYFTAAKQIGVAVSTSPTGPFTDKGSALATGDGTDPIDPMAYIDTDGQAYLYWGNTTLNIQALNADMISLTGTRSHEKPSNYFEAPYMLKRNGTYYLMYSINDYRNDDYHVEYATATGPFGPWTTKGRITSPIGAIKGPGHNAVIRKAGCSDEYYFVYHRRTSTNVDERQVAIDRMFFDASGNILPVDITTSGVVQYDGICYTPNPIADGTYTIRSKVTTTAGAGLYLDIPACATGNADVKTWTRTTCEGQKWTFTYQGNGFYKIINALPNHKALDLNACGLDRGTNIQVWDQLSNDCQLWRLEALGNGYYRMMAKGSNNVMDLENSDPTPGADIRSWTWNGANAQQFAIETP